MRAEAIIEAARDKLGIGELNALQRQVVDELLTGSDDAIIISPTGSGKTLAYLLPTLACVDGSRGYCEAVVIAPTRELVLQIFDVARRLSGGAKVTAVYGGHSARDEARSLLDTPAVLIATPGRLLDHLQRGHIDISRISSLVLDEFDKTLELGFSDEVARILNKVSPHARKILTSATAMSEFPPYIKLRHIHRIESEEGDATAEHRLSLRIYRSPEPDKLQSLAALLTTFEPQERAIVFVNYRDAVERVFNFVKRLGIATGFYHGALEQHDREKVVEMMANGSISVLVSTDLAARGLDLPQVEHIIHYHRPTSEQVFTHRNGRTARIDATGSAHLILGPDEELPDYINADDARDIATLSPTDCRPVLRPSAVTLYFHAGRKEKISRADIVGFLLHNSDLAASQIGIINNHDHFTLVAIKDCPDVARLIATLSSAKLKGKRVRLSQGYA